MLWGVTSFEHHRFISHSERKSKTTYVSNRKQRGFARATGITYRTQKAKQNGCWHKQSIGTKQNVPEVLEAKKSRASVGTYSSCMSSTQSHMLFFWVPAINSMLCRNLRKYVVRYVKRWGRSVQNGDSMMWECGGTAIPKVRHTTNKGEVEVWQNSRSKGETCVLKEVVFQ